MLKLKSTKTKKTVTVTNTYQTKIEGLEVIETIIDKKKPIYSFNGKGPHNSWPTLVKPNFFEFIKENNPWSTVKNVYGWSEIAYKEKDFTLELIEKCIQTNLLIFAYTDGHMIFDVKGKIIPYARYYDYIGTVFDNKRADLPKMIDHLKKHSWTINKEELKIHDIPYYNQDEGRTQYIAPKLLPDQKTYQKLYEKVKEDKFWSCRLEDLIKGTNIEEGIDPMKLKKFLKPRKDDY